MTGSSRIDEMYRAFRRGGLEERAAIREVFRSGHTAGSVHGQPFLSEADAEVADSIYHAERFAGRTHVEALDEVFLAGYALGRSPAAA